MILGDIFLLIILNLVMMAVLFVVGIQQFQKIKDKPKGHLDRKYLMRNSFSLTKFDPLEKEIRQLVRDEAYDTAVKRLMELAELDVFTAESTIEQLIKEEYRPYYEQNSSVNKGE